MDLLVLLVFALVYLGMVVGRLPGLALDRTGLALLGAIALVVAGRLSLPQAWAAVDLPTLALLFALMIVSGQLRLGGFYGEVTERLGRVEAPPERLLALLVVVAGGLSALLTNDIVCLAMAPLVARICIQRQLDPRPFLLALACAANVGSAATLIGNPQNILIGQALHLDFARYLLAGGVPAFAGLAAVWWVIARHSAGGWQMAAPPAAPENPALHPGQVRKGLLVLALLVTGFLLAPWPREILALAAAGILFTSRRLRSRQLLAEVDWSLLVLFIGLFVVNHALVASGMVARALAALQGAGVDLARPGWLFLVTVPLSNLVSNVPATMLLLPAAQHPLAGPVLALASTLAGNLLVVGSIANLIVLDQAQQLGIGISWREHARVGVPVTVLTLALAAAWLALLAVLG